VSVDDADKMTMKGRVARIEKGFKTENIPCLISHERGGYALRYREAPVVWPEARISLEIVTGQLLLPDNTVVNLGDTSSRRGLINVLANLISARGGVVPESGSAVMRALNELLAGQGLHLRRQGKHGVRLVIGEK
jgi:hypothetical protein